MTPKLFALLLSGLALLAHADEPAALPAELELHVGQTQLLAVQARRIILGRSRALAISRPDASHLLVAALQPGDTHLQIWDRVGQLHSITVHVTSLDLDQIEVQVRELLRGVDGLQMRRAGGRIVVDVAHPNADTNARIDAVAKMYPDVVVGLVRNVGWEKTVLMEVRIVELRELSWRDVGLRWQEEIAGPRAAAVVDVVGSPRLRSVAGVQGGAVTALDALPAAARTTALFMGLATSLDSRLHLLQQQGHASLIAEPVLSCRSGGSARFVSGGEIPLPVANGLGATSVEYKEYGVILDVQPQVGVDDAIFARLETELSQIDPTQAVLGVPAILKRRTVTEINLHAGETLVLAGLSMQTAATGQQGLPRLSAMRRAGHLFGERTRRKEHTELAIFITARVIDAQASELPLAGADYLQRRRQLVQESARE